MEIVREVRKTKNGTPKYVYLYDGIEFARKKDAVAVKEKFGVPNVEPERVECVDAELVSDTAIVPLQVVEREDPDLLDDRRVRGLANYASTVTNTLNGVFADLHEFFEENRRITRKYAEERVQLEAERVQLEAEEDRLSKEQYLRNTASAR